MTDTLTDTDSDAFDVDAARRLLDAFLVENEELETLGARLSAFNMFQVLRIEKIEIRHSNVLGWLLSPDGSHGLGNVFLRRFLSRLLLDNETAPTSLTPSQVELMSFTDIEVLREWQNIDVLVHSGAGRWCLLIENKIRTKERKGQLQRYMARVGQEMPNHEIIPVFLTLEGEEPSDVGQELGFLTLSHAQVLELAEQIIRQHSSRIPDDARTFLDHYLETLRRLTMQDQELVELCKTIYRKHGEAIDLIIEYGTANNFHDACAVEIGSAVECEFIKSARGSVWFLPKALGDLTRPVSMTGWGFLPRETPIACWCRRAKKRGALRMVLEVGPVADASKRQALLMAMRAAGFEIKQSSLREGAKFTRLTSHSTKLAKDEEGETDWSDEEIRKATRALWRKLEPSCTKAAEAFQGFHWD